MPWGVAAAGIGAYAGSKSKGGGGKKPPKSPNYKKLSQMQFEQGRQIAQEQTRANRPTQVNQFGRVDWQEGPNGQWTQTETLDPTLKAANEKSMILQDQLMGKIQNQGDFQGPEAVQWDDKGYEKYGDALYEQTMNRARPEMARKEEQYNTRLIQQGLQPGSEAYDRAMQNMLTSHGDVSTQAALNARVQGGQEYRQDFNSQLQGQNQEYGQAMSEYQMPWDQAGANQGLMQGGRNNFQGFAGATGYQGQDMMGAAQAGYNNKMGAYNAKEQAAANKKSGTMGQVGQVGGAAMMAMSDSTLKHDITPIGGETALETILALRGVAWKWNETNAPDIGVIAQEVRAVLEDLVSSEAEYLRVNYTKIAGLAIEAVKELERRVKSLEDAV